LWREVHEKHANKIAVREALRDGRARAAQLRQKLRPPSQEGQRDALLPNAHSEGCTRLPIGKRDESVLPHSRHGSKRGSHGDGLVGGPLFITEGTAMAPTNIVRVLLVEDNAGLRDAVCGILVSDGFAVAAVTNGVKHLHGFLPPSRFPMSFSST
jgi:hypothetical protein